MLFLAQIEFPIDIKKNDGHCIKMLRSVINKINVQVFFYEREHNFGITDGRKLVLRYICLPGKGQHMS